MRMEPIHVWVLHPWWDGLQRGPEFSSTHTAPGASFPQSKSLLPGSPLQSVFPAVEDDCCDLLVHEDKDGQQQSRQGSCHTQPPGVGSKRGHQPITTRECGLEEDRDRSERISQKYICPPQFPHLTPPHPTHWMLSTGSVCTCPHAFKCIVSLEQLNAFREGRGRKQALGLGSHSGRGGGGR